jgi:hypothetical protein
MSKTSTPLRVLTANRLGDGRVVFFDWAGGWSDRLGEARIARSPEEGKALEALGAAEAARNLVVDPYLVDLRQAEGRLIPVRHRERVRIAGPSMLAAVPGYLPPSGGGAGGRAKEVAGDLVAPDTVD